MYARQSRYAPAETGTHRHHGRLPTDTKRHVPVLSDRDQSVKSNRAADSLSAGTKPLAVGFIAIGPWSGCCRPCHAAGRTARIAPALLRPAASLFPMFRAPGKNQTRAASSLGTMQNIRRPGHAKSRPQVHRSYTPGEPQARESGMAVHVPRAAVRPPQRPRPRNGNRMRCRHDYRTAAGGTTRRQPPRAACAREFPDIYPPAQAPPRAADRNASPPLPSWHTGQPRHSRP